MDRFLTRVTSKILPLALFTLLTDCNPKPSVELCNRYYQAVVRIARSGPRVFSLISRKSSAKAGVLDFCLSQPRHQIECALGAVSMEGLSECENRPKQGIRDSLPDLDDWSGFGSEE